jgi:hypothetical protein
MRTQSAKPALETIATELADWFADIARFWSSAYFDWSTSSEHRDAAILEVLASSAKTIIETPVDSQGKLYAPLTLTLAAAAQRHGVMPAARHWLAAIHNVRKLRSQTDFAKAKRFGLSIGTPATVFKNLFCEALVQAGVTDRPTILVEQNRRASLGLALNWGLRFLIAYALEIRPGRPGDRAVRDLRWVQSLLRVGT